MGSGVEYSKCYQCYRYDYECRCRPDHTTYKEFYTRQARAHISLEVLKKEYEKLTSNLTFAIDSSKEDPYLSLSNEYNIYCRTLEVTVYATEIMYREHTLIGDNCLLRRTTKVVLPDYYTKNNLHGYYADYVEESTNLFGIHEAIIELEYPNLVLIKVVPVHSQAETSWELLCAGIHVEKLHDSNGEIIYPSFVIYSGRVDPKYYFSEFPGFEVYAMKSCTDYINICLVRKENFDGEG